MRVLAVALALALCGCASSPKAPAPTQASVPSDAQSEELIAAIENAIEQGYKIRNQDGQRLFCRKDLTTGSRVHSTLKCLTEDELLAEQRGARDFVEGIQRMPNRMKE